MFLNKRMISQANRKRSEGPDLKEGDKVYLWRRNIRTKRQNSKLDFLKIGPFKVKRIIGPVNYELQLPKSMKIHPIFHVSLLEKADPETPLDKETELEDPTEQEYEVEKILDHQVRRRQHFYLIKWKGYPQEENTWEPYKNLNCPFELSRYHHENPMHSKPLGFRRPE